MPNVGLDDVPLLRSRIWDYLALFCLVGLVFSSIHIIPRLGVSWDEHYHLKWGAEKWDNYAALFRGEIGFQEFSTLQHSSVHPGFFDLILQGLIRSTDLQMNVASHVLSFVFGFLGCVAVWLLARKLFGSFGGFLGLLMLIATPRYFGHMWFNPKDIPFAACYAWSLYFLVVTILDFPRPKWRHVVLLGMCTGFGLGVRMAALLIPLYFGLACGLYLALRSWKESSFAKDLCLLAPRGFLAAGVAFLAALPFWPALWSIFVQSDSGSGGIMRGISEAQNFGWDGPVLYSGAFERSTDLPWHYLPKWILVTLPELTLGLICVALVIGVSNLMFHPRRVFDRRGLGIGIVAFSAVFPVVYVVATGPTLYDGMRHFIFVLPPFVIVALAGCVGLLFILLPAVTERRWLAWMFPALTAVACLKIITVDYRSLNPFFYSYFNVWVGGIGGAFNNYETDYWGLSYREAMEGLGEYIAGLDAKPDGRPWTVAISGAGFLVGPFIPDSVELVRDRATADFYVAYTRVNRHAEGKGEIVRVVAREGVPLNVVWDQR